MLATLALAFAMAADPAPKRLLLVTHSGGFVHPSVATAEEVLKEVGPKNGFAVTCWRWTGEPSGPAFDKAHEEFRKKTKKTIEPEHMGRINAQTLKNFDVVLFFTTGNPLTKTELADLRAWVTAGGAFAGTHCATDTLYGEQDYGELIGGYFAGHPAGLQKVKIKVDDPKHPAAAAFADGSVYEDEMYVFGPKGDGKTGKPQPFQSQPYSRDKVNVILSIEKGTFKPTAKDAKGDYSRPDGDYAISWSKAVGDGRVFYTSFGHQDKVWKDPKFQQHLFAGLKWALKE